MRIRLATPLTLGEIAKACEGETKSVASTSITHVCTDSRELEYGDLFWCLFGKSERGSDYIGEAIKKGAYTLSEISCKSDIFHPDPNRAILIFGAAHIKTLPYLLYRIAITGSVGKTTTKEFLKILLSEQYKVHASEGNYNSVTGMPMSLLTAPQTSEIIISEMGMNGPNEISKMSLALCPDIAIITNIGSAHIGRLGSREAIASAKSEVTDGMKNGSVLVPYAENLLKKSGRNISFSASDIAANIYVEWSENGRVSIYKNHVKICESPFVIKEQHHLECLAAAIGAALLCGMDPDLISRGVARISRDNTRQSVFLCKNRHIYSDCYNASYESMLAGIEEFIKASPNGRRSLVLGDILELGNYSHSIHSAIGAAISKTDINRLFLLGKECSAIASGAIKNGFPEKRISINLDTTRPDVTADQIMTYTDEDDHLYFKASHGIALWRVIDIIRGDIK